MTIDDRLARLERKCRALAFALVTVTAFAACVSLPPLRAQFGRYVPDWISDSAGRVTYGDTLHYSGATADIIGRPDDDAGLSIIAPHGPTGREAYLIHGFTVPDSQPGTFLKAMSFSTVWSQRPFPQYGEEPVLLSRIGTTYIGPDDARRTYYIGLMQCGGYGAVFYPSNPTNGAECPGEANAVAFSGNTYARKDLHVTGRLFVNGREIR